MFLPLIILGILVYIYFGFKLQRAYARRPFSGRRIYILTAIFLVATGVFLLGLSQHYHSLGTAAHWIAGVSWLIMIFAPCSFSIFNRNDLLWTLRGLAFMALGTKLLSLW